MVGNHSSTLRSIDRVTSRNIFKIVLDYLTGLSLFCLIITVIYSTHKVIF